MKVAEKYEKKSLYLATSIAAGAVGPQSVVIAPLLVSALISGMHLPGNIAGLIMSAELMSVAIASFVIAPKMATFSRRTVVVAGSFIAIAGYVSSMFVMDTSLLFLTRSVAGAGAGLVLAGGNACVAFARDPDRLYSLVILMTGLTHLLLLVLGPLFINHWSYSGAGGMQAVFVLLLLPILFLIPRHSPIEINTSATADVPSYSRPAALAICVAVILFFAHNGAVWSFSQEIGRRTGLTDQQIGLILGLTGFICLLGAVGASVLSTKYGRLRPLLAGIIICLILAVSITLTNNPIVYTVCQAFYQAAIFFTVPYLFGLAAKLDSLGRVVAAAGGGLMFGSALGPAIAGFLIGLGGYVLVALFILVSLIIVTFLSLAVDRHVEQIVLNP